MSAKVFSCLATAAGFVTVFSSVAVAQEFHEVTAEVGLVPEANTSWGNPIWGDINNDAFLDLIVPTGKLQVSGGPFVYLNNAGEAFTDIRATSGIEMAPSFDTGDWRGFSFGDFDGGWQPRSFHRRTRRGERAETRSTLQRSWRWDV